MRRILPAVVGALLLSTALPALSADDGARVRARRADLLAQRSVATAPVAVELQAPVAEAPAIQSRRLGTVDLLGQLDRNNPGALPVALDGRSSNPQGVVWERNSVHEAPVAALKSLRTLSARVEGVRLLDDPDSRSILERKGRAHPMIWREGLQEAIRLP